MSNEPLVVLLPTGGTVATTIDPRSGRSVPCLGGEVLLEGVKDELEGVRVEVEEEEEPRPSWALAPADFRRIALRARDLARRPSVAGVVVTHGTTTMEYSAFLTDLVTDGERPVVFTGALRRADHPDPDGPSNLRDAIFLAAHREGRSLGVVVCMAGRVLAAREAWKRGIRPSEAFEGLHGGLGAIEAGTLRLWRRPIRPEVFGGDVDPAVALIKAYPGAGPEVVDASLRQGMHGIVVEGLPGVGGVPARMTDGLRSALEADVVVVIATRAPHGRVPDPPTGGTGEPLAGLDLVSAGDLTPEQAWVLLMVALAESGGRREGVRAIFRRMTDTQAMGKEEEAT